MKEKAKDDIRVYILFIIMIIIFIFMLKSCIDIRNDLHQIKSLPTIIKQDDKIIIKDNNPIEDTNKFLKDIYSLMEEYKYNTDLEARNEGYGVSIEPVFKNIEMILLELTNGIEQNNKRIDKLNNLIKEKELFDSWYYFPQDFNIGKEQDILEEYNIFNMNILDIDINSYLKGSSFDSYNWLGYYKIRKEIINTEICRTTSDSVPEPSVILLLGSGILLLSKGRFIK